MMLEPLREFPHLTISRMLKTPEISHAQPCLPVLGYDDLFFDSDWHMETEFI
jgi:hypothetical protein